jgi:hypothetical protein
MRNDRRTEGHEAALWQYFAKAMENLYIMLKHSITLLRMIPIKNSAYFP